MRLLVLLIVIVNLGLFAFGKGYLGVPPSQAGRSVAQGGHINLGQVTLGEPALAAHRTR